MFTEKELDDYLRYATLHPAEFIWAAERQEGAVTLEDTNLFRPGEQIGLNVHPTNDGPPLPSGLPEPHRHGFIEISYVWDGQCEMTVEGRKFPMDTGDLLILDTHSSHVPHVPRGTLLINLELQTSFFDDVFFRQISAREPLAEFFIGSIYSQKAVKRCLMYQTQNDPRLRQLFTMLMQEYFSEEVCSRTIIENLTMILFSTMIRLQRQKSIDVSEGSNDAFVSEALEYMQGHLETVTREDLADHFGYSYSYITTLLQTATGMTFSKLKRTLCMQRAELLLRSTGKSIADVARASGFHNMTRFYEAFRNSYGVSPLEYRNSSRSGAPAAEQDP